MARLPVCPSPTKLSSSFTRQPVFRQKSMIADISAIWLNYQTDLVISPFIYRFRNGLRNLTIGNTMFLKGFFHRACSGTHIAINEGDNSNPILVINPARGSPNMK